MNVVGLTGLPRSGKDTAAQWFVRHGYRRLGFADPLKEAAAVLLGRPLWQMHGEDGFDRETVLPEWGFSTRWFLQRLGTECLREQIRGDFWVQKMRNEIARFSSPVVITDVRFKNEVPLVRELGGIIIEIRRPGCTASGHVSDAGVETDYVILNSGTVADLYREIAGVMQSHHADTKG